MVMETSFTGQPVACQLLDAREDGAGDLFGDGLAQQGVVADGGLNGHDGAPFVTR
jgi:hypothetical protein